MPLKPDTRVMPVLTRLMGCVETHVEAAGFKPCFLGIVAGAMPDSTPVGPDTGPMFWLRPGDIVPVLPEGQASGLMTCATELRVDVQVGFFTCYPIDPDGDPLSVEQNLEIADEVSSAMWALHQAINCCTWTKNPSTRQKVAYDVTTWVPAGPMGGVVGGAWTLQVIV